MTAPNNLDPYFERIHFRDSATVSLETLQALHIGHCLNIPFENLDIHMGRTISLVPAALFQKQVEKRRGGYCYELNGLFAWVLETLGFPVERMLARVLLDGTRSPRTHQVLLVHLEGRDWLVDVGFGGRGLVAPIPLEDSQMEKQFAETVRLIQEGEAWVLQTQMGDTWQSQYEFTLAPQDPVDFEPGNFYMSTSSDSPFTRKILCTLPTIDGLICLEDQELSILANGKTVIERANTLEEYRMVLKKHFNLEPEGTLKPPWLHQA